MRVGLISVQLVLLGIVAVFFLPGGGAVGGEAEPVLADTTGSNATRRLCAAPAEGPLGRHARRYPLAQVQTKRQTPVSEINKPTTSAPLSVYQL